MAKVSIIVPVYKVERYLAGCLDSILAQSFEDIEVICVNDGSPDSCGNILEHYAKFDNRIKIITKENGGLSSARNAGMEIASGEYILFVDSDDKISSIAVETLYNNAEKNHSDMVIFDNVQKLPQAGMYQQLTIVPLGSNYVDKTFNAETMDINVYKQIPVTACIKFYRADLIRDIKFYEGLIYEDVPYTLEAFARADRVTYLPMPLYYYTIDNPNAITKRAGKDVFDIIKIFNINMELIEKYPRLKAYSEYLKLRSILDFIRLYFKLSLDCRKEYINLLKEQNIKIDYNYFLSDEYKADGHELEKYYLKVFKLMQEMSYEEFSKIHFEVTNA